MPNSYYNSPLGWLEIETNNNELTALRYIVQPPEKKEVTNPINLEIEKQLSEDRQKKIENLKNTINNNKREFTFGY